MIKTKNQLLSRIKISILTLCFVPSLLIGQSDLYKLQVDHLSADHILKKWSHISGRNFNYRVDDLSTELYSFSLEGAYDDVSQELFSYLGLEHKELNGTTILSISSDVQPQPKSKVITVLDEYGYPLPHAHVGISSIGFLDVTSTDGRVTLSMPVASSDTLEFRYVGYDHSILTMEELLFKDMKLSMRPSQLSIAEVIILDKAAHRTSVTAIDPADIPQAGSVDTDALTIAQNLAGISNPSESFQDLVIRGGSPDQVQFLWNGIRIFQPSHFFGKISAINPYMVDKLEISKDGYSAVSSGAISGGLHMKSDSRVQKAEGMVHLNLLYANAGISIPISSKLSAKFAIRQSLPSSLRTPLVDSFTDQIFQFGKIPDTDFFLDMFDIEEFVRKQTGVSFGDQQLSLRFDLSAKTTIHLDVLRLTNSLDFQTISEAFDQFTRDHLQQTNYGYRLSGRHLWSSLFSTSVNASLSDYRYSFEEFPETSNEVRILGEQINEVSQRKVNVSNIYAHPRFTSTFGFEYTSWDTFILLGNREDGRDDDIFDIQAHEEAFFANVQPHISSNLFIDLGLRWSAYSKSFEGRKLIEPRVHAKYKMGDHLSLHGHFGEYHQYLNRRNFFTTLQADNGFWLLSDETPNNFIDIIQSRQFGGGLEWADGRWRFTLDAYRKDIFNLRSESLDFSIEENPFRFGNNTGHGLELLVDYKTNKDHILITYEYTDEQLLLDGFQDATLNPFSQPHRLGVTYQKTWRHLSATIQYNYATGRPFTQAVDLDRQTDDNGDVVPFIDFEELLSERVDDYHRVDISLKAALPGAKRKHSFGVQLNNVLNRQNTIKNQYFLDFRVDPTQLGFLSKQGLRRSFNVFWEIAL